MAAGNRLQVEAVDREMLAVRGDETRIGGRPAGAGGPLVQRRDLDNDVVRGEGGRVVELERAMRFYFARAGIACRRPDLDGAGDLDVDLSRFTAEAGSALAEAARLSLPPAAPRLSAEAETSALPLIATVLACR